MMESENRHALRIAVIATVWTPFSHADVIVTRWLRSIPSDRRCGWDPGDSRIVSVWLDQRPPNDIGTGLCEEYQVPVFATIREALFVGGEDLAVDGVLLIAEHGEYPMNSIGQKLYPRWEFFTEIANVLSAAGKSIPIFNDKHLSWSFAHAREMVSRAAEMGLPFYAASSISHCPLLPGRPISAGEALSEVLALFHGHPDHYGFHTLEFVQSLVEGRAGGESGIHRVRRITGAAVREAIAQGEISADLLRAAFISSGYTANVELLDFYLARTAELYAFQLEYRDGLRVTHLCLQNVNAEWVVALRTGQGIRSVRAEVGAFPDFFSNFAHLNREVYRFFQTKIPPNPIERTLLAGGALEALLQADGASQNWVETPQLGITYGEAASQPPPLKNY